jgi:hypothetical protein
MVIGNPVALQFYASRQEKEAFKRACFVSDTTMSRELRRFIRQFAASPPGDDRLYHQPVADSLRRFEDESNGFTAETSAAVDTRS